MNINWDAQKYDSSFSFVPDYGADVLSLIETSQGLAVDLGCGSGILSIAALLLGANDVTICDIFENAVKTASENIEKNNFTAEKYRAFCGDIISNSALREKIGGGFNVICANIVADVIIGMSGLFADFLAEGGVLIVSGIIDERLDEVLEALSENGWKQVSALNEEGWNCVLLSR